MANSPQARKRARQAEDHRAHNASLRSAMRTACKKVIKAAAQGDREQAESAYRAAVPVIDRLARKGLIHKNNAARRKSRLHRQIKGIGG